MDRLKGNENPKLVKVLFNIHPDKGVKGLSQHLDDKLFNVVKTEQLIKSDKGSLAKHETLDNFDNKPDTAGYSNISLPNVAPGVPLEFIIDNDVNFKVEKTETNNVRKRTKKGKQISLIKQNKDSEKNKEKLMMKKDQIKEKPDNNTKEKKRRLTVKKDNPILSIIREMTDNKPDGDKQMGNKNINVSKHSNRRKQNLKNISFGDELMKLSNENKKNSDSNSGSNTKKESKPLLPPVLKSKLPEYKTILEKKNYSIYIEKKEYVDEKKSVKIFKSKFRSTGLEEQAPLPPHPKFKIQSKKSTNLTHLPLPKAKKRSLSPPLGSLNEKKHKIAHSDSKEQSPKIGESGLFMDAALNVLNSEKLKLKPDIINKVTEPLSLEAPSLTLHLNFYRDTLLDSTNESLNTDDNKANMDGDSTVDESCKNDSINKDKGLKSALVFVRSKSSKKSVSWKEESELVQVSYFEHDATERVNVNRTFKAMKMRERDIERQNLIAARKLTNDYMEPKTPWRNLDDSLLIYIPKEPGKEKIEPGSESIEKKKHSLREQSVIEAIYITRNMIPDSPEEPDEMQIFPFYEPLNIPLEDMSGDIATIYNYVNIPWPESKNEQPPIVEMMQQQQFPVYSGNQFNWVMPPDNMMGMIPLKYNNYNMPPNRMMINNQMFMSEQMQQQPQLLPPHQQQQILPPQHLVQEDQWMGPPRPPMHHNQYWNQQQLPINNGPPLFERGGHAGGHGLTRWNNYSRGGNCDFNRRKMNVAYQRGNRGGPFNCRGGHPGNGRAIRLCKYFAKQGFCKTPNCKFFHSKS